MRGLGLCTILPEAGFEQISADSQCVAFYENKILEHAVLKNGTLTIRRH